MVMEGNPEFGVKLQPMDFKMFAAACGASSLRVDNPADIADALDHLLESPGPALLEAVVDPLTAPLPPSIKASQAIKFAESLARGEPKARKIMQEAFMDRARELV
jgi:pyruvate dehydrogenase (quinone)/pyruvate oxidase